MDKQLYIQVGILKWIIQAIPDSADGDSIAIAIKRLSDGYTWNFSTLAFTEPDTSGTMTFDSGNWWKASFTPDTADTFLVTITKGDVSYYQELVAQGAVAQAGLTGTELTTLANLRAFLRKQTNDTADDSLLTSIITRISAEAEKRCGRSFADADVTEYHEGDGTSELLVRRPPINSISSIHIDSDREWASGSAVDSDNIIISDEVEGMVILNGDYFEKGLGVENVRVIYNGGYSTIPADLERCILRLCAWDYLESARWNNTMIKGERPVMEERESIWKEITNKYKIGRF